jgi:hypothetical protein
VEKINPVLKPFDLQMRQKRFPGLDGEIAKEFVIESVHNQDPLSMTDHLFHDPRYSLLLSDIENALASSRRPGY